MKCYVIQNWIRRINKILNCKNDNAKADLKFKGETVFEKIIILKKCNFIMTGR